MGRRKVGVCKCGHEIVKWHDATGLCVYGEGTLHGAGCQRDHNGPCAKPGRGKAPSPARAVESEIVDAGKALVEAFSFLAERYVSFALAVSHGIELGCERAVKQAMVRDSVPTKEVAMLGVAPKQNGAAKMNASPLLEEHRAMAAGPNGRPAASRDDDDEIGRGPLAILRCLAERDARGCTTEEIAVVTGYKSTSRRTYLQWLTSRDYARGYKGDRYFITGPGRMLVGDVESLHDKPADYWLEHLPEGESTVFGAVVVAGRTTKQLIADQTGYKSTSVRTYVQKLRARELVTVDGASVSLRT